MITLSAQIQSILPRFRLGAIIYKGITVAPSPGPFRGRFQLFQEHLRLEHNTDTIGQIPAIQAMREAFRRAGASPSRYRPSAEALLRRVLKGENLSTVNSAVDANNFFSLKYRLPFGIYDLSTIDGDIVCDIGGENDAYQGLNGREIQMDGKILLRDAKGAFGSPYVDSTRTGVTEQTRDCLQIIFAHEMEDEELLTIAKQVSHWFVQLNGGDIAETSVIR